MELIIRPATEADAETIAGFNRAMAAETEDCRLDPVRVLAGVRAVLGDPAKGFYTLAAAGERVAGQLMITYEWSDWRNGVFWWIQSVYVAPEFRRQGVFRRLYDHVLQGARAAEDVCGVRLYVEAGNRQAQHTYEQLGMKRTPYGMYEIDFVLGRAGETG